MSEPFTFQQLPSFLLKALSEQGLTEPTNIQEKMIPEALDGQSLIARSQTGTGKTLAYLLPTLAKMNQSEKRLQAIILAPTQELAMQVVEVARQLTKEQPIAIGAFIGGANIKRQLERLKKQKPQLAIGTPGRLLELIELRKLKVHELDTVIVDEADRMIAERPSWEATMQIAKRAGRKAQYLFVSATIPNGFQNEIADVAPFVIELEADGGLLNTENVEHLFVRGEPRDKIDLVRRIIHAEKIKKGIVFVNQLETAIEATDKLIYRGIKALTLSSEQTKQERERALNEFHKGTTEILVATDLAARGLDVDNVTHIIQLDAPSSSDNYLHRAGRTGRMGKKGIVITLIDKRSEYKLERYNRDLQVKIEERYLSHGQLKGNEHN